MKKVSPIIFSITVTVIIAIFFIISIFCILYFYWGNSSAVKDSLTTVGSFFGGFATLGAAIIAAYLFTDWKDAERFSIAKDTLVALIKLKSHLDTNYNTAKFHLESYRLKERSEPPSDAYITERINNAKISMIEREKYRSEISSLLTIFLEKVDLYETILGDILIKKEDRDFNFINFSYFISLMYKQACNGDLENIIVTDVLSDGIKKDFEDDFYKDLITKLKSKAL